MFAYFTPVLLGMIQLIVLSLIGYILRRKDFLSESFFGELSHFLVTVALPLYYFVKVSRTDVNDIVSSLILPIGAVVILASTYLVSRGYFSLLGYQGQDRKTAMALSIFGNAGFMPLFLVQLFPTVMPQLRDKFGTTTPLLYVGVYLFVASPALWAGGNYLMSGTPSKPTLRQVVSPPIFGIIAGLLVPITGIRPLLDNPSLPFSQIMSAFQSLGDVIFSLMLVCLGASIANLPRITRESAPDLVRMSVHVSIVRFLFVPGLFFAFYFAVIRPLALTPTHAWVFFLQMTIPSATSIAVLATRTRTNEDKVAFSLLVNYLLYIFVLPLYLMVFFALPGVQL
ncbi:MAG TPA: AEC family transporter [Spirochaetia bacterium]|nr:AEC family transporter [Spirochaetia bacterium]